MLLTAAVCASFAGCGWILGIDDGTPLDASTDGGANTSDGSTDDQTLGTDGGADTADDTAAPDDATTHDATRADAADSGGRDAGAEACVADAAAACGAQTCGTQYSCGLVVPCGPACPTDGGGGCVPDAAADCVGHCGGASVIDRCTATIQCYDPCYGEVCYRGSCCPPPQCAGQCGPVTGCGQTIACMCPEAGGMDACVPMMCDPTTCRTNCGQTCCMLDAGGPPVDAGPCLAAYSQCPPGGGFPPCCGNAVCTQQLGTMTISASSASGPMPDAMGPPIWTCQ